jgi:hypothetical protein
MHRRVTALALLAARVGWSSSSGGDGSGNGAKDLPHLP